MGYNILHTKNTKLCVIKWKPHQAEQALNHLRELAYATMELTQENAVKAIWLTKVLVVLH